MTSDHQSAPPQVIRPAVRRSSQVRTHLTRNALPLLVAAVVLCAVVVWRRDITHINNACARAEIFALPVRSYVANHGTLPESYPDESGNDWAAEHFEYESAPVLAWAKEQKKRVIVGWGPATGLIVKPNGHAAIVYDNGNINVTWMAGKDIGFALKSQRKSAELSTTE